ncbi:MAG: rhodanese-related sulfurtransferase [Alphaproteobacteria bacterium]|jgi:rhodanese-related sulfurtransferase
MAMETINIETLQLWVEKDESIIVDVRELAEHDAQHIDGAILISLGDITKNILPVIGDSKKLVIHCRSGKRSLNACEKLLAEDPNMEIYNLEGGIEAWSKARNPVISSGKFFLPLDRQVQLTIGLGVLTSSLLAYFINPLFLLLTGLFGAGLTFAGLSGFCGLGVMMGKTPWNKISNKSSTSCCMK